MPWAFACLACNETWSSASPAAHACTAPVEALRDYWTNRLRWTPSLRDKPAAQVRALASKPINRALLVQLLGASWDPAGDDGARIPLNKAREVAA